VVPERKSHANVTILAMKNHMKQVNLFMKSELLLFAMHVLISLHQIWKINAKHINKGIHKEIYVHIIYTYMYICPC